MGEHIYIAERAKGFNFTVVFDDKRVHVRFVDGQFKTDDDNLAAAIDELREKNGGVARRCRKADRAAAEKLAREHRAMLARTGATKGGITAEAARHAMDVSLAERDLKLRSQNVDFDEFADENLQMTQKVNQPDKIIPDEIAKGIVLGLEVAASRSQDAKKVKPVALKVNAIKLGSAKLL